MEPTEYKIALTKAMSDLSKLDETIFIGQQIIYAGKFKSATEPLRETQMTEANRLQTSVWLGDLYNQFLYQTAAARNLDTALIRSLAVEGKIQTAADAKKVADEDAAADKPGSEAEEGEAKA